MSKDHSDTDKLRAFIDAVEADILNASDEEILEDIRAGNEDPDKVAEDTKGVVVAAIAAHRQQKLHAARQAYDEVAQARQKSRIPDDPDEQRALLHRIIQQRPDLPEGVTMAFRDGEGMSDADVETTLQDLAALGILDEEPDKGTS